jgi:hypothetical protein
VSFPCSAAPDPVSQPLTSVHDQVTPSEQTIALAGGHGEGKDTEADAEAGAGGRPPPAPRPRWARHRRGGVRGCGLPAVHRASVARPAAAGALGGAGALRRRAGPVIPPLGRGAPRRAALPQLHRVHARRLPLRCHFRSLRLRRHGSPVAQVSSIPPF